MIHYCPSCGHLSFPTEADNARTWRVTCPECGHTTRQHPHPPEVERRKRPAPDLDETIAAVLSALVAGDRVTADRLLVHAAHGGIAPSDLLLAGAADDDLVERGRSARAARADAAAERPAETVLDDGSTAVDLDEV